MRFGTIMIDPPWPYSGAAVVGAGGRGYADGSIQVGLREHYSTMRIEEIAKLPVPSLSLSQAHLYLWFTNAFGEEAHWLARRWGYAPKTIVTWAKVKSDGVTPSMKTGYYWRGASEHFLFAVRGKLRTTNSPPRPTWFPLPRESHSVKPQFFYDLAQEQSPGPYLEMFARRRRLGWEAWGNEVKSTIAILSEEEITRMRMRHVRAYGEG